MKRSLPVLVLSGLFGSSTVYAASLHVPMAFEYLALDGQKISRDFLAHQSELELSRGYHEIAIRYYDMVVTDLSDTPETVTSPAFIISLDITDDADLFLEPAGGGVIRHPQQYAESPDVVITRRDGGRVDYRFTQTDITQKEFSSRLYRQDVSPDMTAAAAVAPAAPPAEGSPPSPAILATPAAAGSSTSSSAVESGDTAATPAQMLQIWWQRADEATRKEFLSWAVKQL